MEKMYVQLYKVGEATIVNVFFKGELYIVKRSDFTFEDYANIIDNLIIGEETDVEVFIDNMGLSIGLYDRLIKRNIKVSSLGFTKFDKIFGFRKVY